MSPRTLVLRNLTRHKTRLTLTVIAVAIAFAIYGIMAAFQHNFGQGGTTGNADRHVTVNKIGIFEPLPLRYVEEIRAVPHVSAVSYRNMIVAYFQEPKNKFAILAVEPLSYLQIYNDYVVSAEERGAFANDRNSLLVGEALAKRFGFKRGQIVPVNYRPSTADPRKRVEGFKIAGIFSGRTGDVSTGLALASFDHMNEAKFGPKDTVDSIVLTIGCSECSGSVARAIDARFRNSAYETSTQTEEAFSRALVSQVGNLTLITTLISGAGFFTILLIAGSTMSASIRGRTAEIGVMRTLGFSPGSILGSILAESVIVAAIGAAIGTLAAILANAALRAADPALFGRMALTSSSLAAMVVIVVIFGVAAAIVPAGRALQGDVREALLRRSA